MPTFHLFHTTVHGPCLHEWIYSSEKNIQFVVNYLCKIIDQVGQSICVSDQSLKAETFKNFMAVICNYFLFLLLRFGTKMFVEVENLL